MDKGTDSSSQRDVNQKLDAKNNLLYQRSYIAVSPSRLGPFQTTSLNFKTGKRQNGLAASQIK